MTGVFFIVGPTAAGKTEIAAGVAASMDAEIVNADAFQIYDGFPILSAKPDPETLAKVPHHLIGAIPVTENMNAAKFREMALHAIRAIHARNKTALVVGGSGLYIKALTHGLDVDWTKVDVHPQGVLLFRNRDELYARINQRVQDMFARGAIDEVRNAGVLSSTASKMIGVPEIREHLEGKISLVECVARIQQNTRQYAKRQLTWFRNQTTFELLNLSLVSHGETGQWISQLRKRRELDEQG